MSTYRFPVQQFRAIPSPSGKSRTGLFYAPASSFPRDLWDWRDVNPREVNPRSSVYHQIEKTLIEEPERFHERNRGITIVVDELTFDDKRKEAILTLNDKKLHGVVDGAHTMHAILESHHGQSSELNNGSPAYVFVKVLVDIDAEQIAEIAGGLNTSQQVDLKSLENLREHFSQLQGVLKGQSYADKIAYKMNEDKPIDVREVLYYLAVFDKSVYDDNKHPVALFGRKEGIVRRFAEQASLAPGVGDSFNILITRAPDILKLRDLIEKGAVSIPSVGRYKAGKGTRIRSPSHKKSPLLFLDEEIDGKIPLGWVMPMLAAFRANVQWDEPKGTFSWIVPIEELVESCIERLVLGIKDVHEQENSRPEYVGRNTISWRMSYNTVSQAILEWELKKVRSSKR